VDSDATEADAGPRPRTDGDDDAAGLPEATEALTQAASPQAIAHVAAHTANASASQAGASQAGASQLLRPTGTGAGAQSRQVGLTAAAVLDKSDLPRMRAFHWFGITAPLGAVALSLLLGGDPIARLLFWIGAGVLATCNVGLLVLSRRRDARYDSWAIGALWMASTLAVQPAVYYFGPFSAVVMVDMLGIVFIALGRARWTALATTAICIGGHIALALPMVAGWIADRGVLSSRIADPEQLVVAELLIAVFLAAGYLLGRWARTTSANALNELQSAIRLIGDQQQALAEHADAARLQRANEGRWTGHQMGAFRLGLVLGRGAMGEVYEASRADDATQMAAVKLLNARATGSSSLVERFHREMEVAARLRSPHIVRVFELSAPDAPVPYIAMERLYGTDLASKLRAEPRMPSDELVQMLDQVARGLEVARLAGVVHRDLKPHNLFQHESATWKILDFGVSKLVDGEGTLTGEGIVGTPQYMAPEQAQGGTVTHLADVYALGAIAYRCLTGRSPFKGKDLAELVYQVVHKPPLRPGTLGRVSGPLEDVLAVAMAKDPKKRFPSALAFAQAFVAARRGRPVELAVPADAWIG
jgi:serine/threonine-protein kinase